MVPFDRIWRSGTGCALLLRLHNAEYLANGRSRGEENIAGAGIIFMFHAEALQ